MARKVHSPLNDFINDQLKAHPDGMTLSAISALARAKHSKGADSVSVSAALHDLQLADYVTPGPWLLSNGEPAPRGAGGCVRKWYAKEHAPS